MAIIKENARALMGADQDSLHDGDIRRIGTELVGAFKDKYPDLDSKINEEMAKIYERDDSIAKAGLLYFTGELVSDTFNVKSKDYIITVESATTHERKVFHYTSPLPKAIREMTIGYRVDVNKKTKVKTLVVRDLAYNASPMPEPDVAKSYPTVVKNIPAAKNTYAWTGRVGTRAVFMRIIIKNGIIQGEVFYREKKGNTSRKLIGHIGDKGLIRVLEYQSDGYIPGIFVFDRISDSAAGKWQSTATDKAYKFTLSAKDTLLQRIDTDFKPKRIAGDYVFMYGDKGPQGSISVKQSEDRPELLNLTCSIRDPVSYSSMTDSRSAVLKNNQCLYTVTALASCSFLIKFYNNFLIVDEVKNDGNTANDCSAYKGFKGVYYRVGL